jgi:hypothetical protein
VHSLFTRQAIYAQDEGYVLLSLEKGAQANRTNWLGQPVLHEAAATGE